MYDNLPSAAVLADHVNSGDLSVEFSPSDDERVLNDTVVSLSHPDLTWVLKKTIVVPANYTAGTIRVVFNLKTDYGPSAAGARIYKNGTPFGTSRSTNSTSYVVYSQDLAFASGDNLELYMYNGETGTSYSGYVSLRYIDKLVGGETGVWMI